MSVPNSIAAEIEPLGLTGRQMEIVEFLGLGCTNQEISRFLGISVNTVKAHVTALYRQLGVGNRTEAVYRFRQNAAIAASAIIPWSTATVSVLPFEAAGLADPGLARASALADAVTLRMSRWPRFPVVGAADRQPSMNQDMPRIPRSLGPTYVVMGSLASDGERVRVGIKLMASEHGLVHWAQFFDLPAPLLLIDLDAMASLVVATLMPEILKAEQVRTNGRGIETLGPWDKAIRGLHFLETRTLGACRAGAALFQAAVEQAPDLLLAHFGLALCHAIQLLERWSERPEEALELVHWHAKECMALDPSNPDSIHILAFSRTLEGRPGDAVGLLEESLRVNPSSIAGFHLLGLLLAREGRPAAGARCLEEGFRLSAHLAGHSLDHLAFATFRFLQADCAGAADICRQGLLYERGNAWLGELLAAVDSRGDGADCRNLRIGGSCSHQDRVSCILKEIFDPLPHRSIRHSRESSAKD